MTDNLRIHSLFLSIVLFFAFIQCNVLKQDTIHIKGLISNAPPHILFISKYYLDERQELIIDSIRVDQLDQRIDLVIPFIKDSNSLIKLNVGRNALFVFLDDTISDIDLKVNLNDLGNYSVTGPLTNTLFQKINSLLRPFQDSLYMLSNFINNSSDVLRKNILIDQTVSLKTRQHKMMKSFVDTCNSPKTILKIIYDMDFSRFPDELKQLVAELNSKFGSDPGIRKYVSESNSFIKIIENEFKTGDTIPDLKLILTGNHPAQMSGILKDKNLLVFWASYCQSCIQEMTVNSQVAFKTDSIDQIIGLSLDVDSVAYFSTVKRLPSDWLQAYDFKGWRGSIANHFLIDSIPHDIIVDKQLKVLKVNFFKNRNGSSFH
ncbi:MAG: thioredoxin-like domain-containing protein [Saprospiraceae bacterium]